MYQFVFNEAGRQDIQTVVMIVRTDTDNGLLCKLTTPGRKTVLDPVVTMVTMVNMVIVTSVLSRDH